MRTAILVTLSLLALACRNGEPDKPLPDADGDGYTVDVDCDDDDSEVHPGAHEHCDEVDEDCDGRVDEDPVDAPDWFLDDDGDGYGADASAVAGCAAPPDHISDGGDCDDGDPLVNPGVEEDCADPRDLDCDGDPGWEDGDGDGSPSCVDCDDTDPSVRPLAPELCNGADDDCDGRVDEDPVDAVTWYLDGDGDGFGAGEGVVACELAGGVLADGDCDDDDADAWPGADERCNGADDDCDGAVDEGAGQVWWADADADGYGDASVWAYACTAPEGYVADPSDCDDGASAVSPAATEVCNTLDDDCDGLVDEGLTTVFFVDGDGDGHGRAAGTVVACTVPSGYAATADDCDDSEFGVHPGAEERCNTVDDDCDGTVDVGATDARTWYLDRDADGVGDTSSSVEACDAPAGAVAVDGDCDDLDPSAYPGSTEVCDGDDEDCDGDIDEGLLTDWYVDGDGDGYGAGRAVPACTPPVGHVAVDGDCDDTTADVSPVQVERCNAVDDDCDGTTDVGAVDATTWYVDADDDGYGAPGDTVSACAAPAGYVASPADCDDTDGGIHPGAPEDCAAADRDCDGDPTLGATDPSTWYADGDGDGYGDAAVSACEAPDASYLAVGGDCDDADPAVYPGAPDWCDGVDDDCSGTPDDTCYPMRGGLESMVGLATHELVVGTAATLDTDTGEVSGLRAAGAGLVDGLWYEVVTQSDGSELAVLVVDALEVSTGVTLTVVGVRPLALVAADDVVINGTLDLSGASGSANGDSTSSVAGGAAGPGGGDGGRGSNRTYSGDTDGSGVGHGLIAWEGVHYGNGGGGAGACWGGGGGAGDRPTVAGGDGTATAGGARGYGGGDGGRGGEGGPPTLPDVVAGGAGGAGGVSDTDRGPSGGDGGGGGGGGGLQFSSLGDVVVAGVIDATGGPGGDAYGGGGGSGAGGTVFLEGASVDVSGRIDLSGGRGGYGVQSTTNGGAGGSGATPQGRGGTAQGGGGGGAVGWYAIDAPSVAVTGTISGCVL